MNSIWSDITNEDIDKAIELFDKDPGDFSDSINTYLLVDERVLPAKHIRRLAYKIHYNKMPDEKIFKGGIETKEFFENKEYKVLYLGNAGNKHKDLSADEYEALYTEIIKCYSKKALTDCLAKYGIRNYTGTSDEEKPQDCYFQFFDKSRVHILKTKLNIYASYEISKLFAEKVDIQSSFKKLNSPDNCKERTHKLSVEKNITNFVKVMKFFLQFDENWKSKKVLIPRASQETVKMSEQEEFVQEGEVLSLCNEEFEVDDLIIPLEKKVYSNVKISHGIPRDAQKKANALMKAKFKCECDENHETFICRTTNKPYVEAHHLIPMEYYDEFEYSIDVEANIVALCSNCHREIHHGKNAKEKIIILYNKRRELLENAGVPIELDQLLVWYNIP